MRVTDQSPLEETETTVPSVSSEALTRAPAAPTVRASVGAVVSTEKVVEVLAVAALPAASLTLAVSV